MGLEESPRNRQEIEWPDTSPRQQRATRRPKKKSPQLSRRTREMLILVGVNAALSLIISLAVVIVWDAVIRAPTAVPTPVVEAAVTPAHTTARPTVTFTPGPGEPVSYRVQPGDTLLSIAAQFNVAVQDLMIANDLEDPNFIQVGQELIVPVGGLPEPTPTMTPVASPTVAPPSPQPTDTAQPLTPTPTPLPVTPPATEPEVVIRDILGAGVLADEAVLIFNGGRAVRMEGWTLADAQDNIYTFPNLFLGTGGSVRVHTGTGANSATDLYWGLDAPVWGEPGDVATLKDESRLVIDTFDLP
jgi:LysM repeat protein